jgi:hypothetical protein
VYGADDIKAIRILSKATRWGKYQNQKKYVQGSVHQSGDPTRGLRRRFYR